MVNYNINLINYNNNKLLRQIIIFIVIVTKNYLICTYNDSQITLINFLKSKKNIFDKISSLDPKVSTFDLCGPSGRRLEKKIHHNRAEDLVKNN
jgi:hypothetical protein